MVTHSRGAIVKIVLLGLTVAIAIWGAFPLIGNHAWTGLALLAATTAALLYLYLTPRHIPARYLAPGTLFLVAFQLFPVLYTAGTAFTNFGDGHRGSKSEAVVAIQTASVTQVPGSRQYALTLAAKGDRATGPLVFLITDPDTHVVSAGDAAGLEPLPSGDVTVTGTGRVTAARDYTLLTAGQAGLRSKEITAMAVPTGGGRSARRACPGVRGPGRAGLRAGL